MNTKHTIGKSIAIFITATLVLNAMAPMLAHAAKHLQGDQVNANALVRDAYIAVTYRGGNGRERTARGWIDAIGETSFTIRSGGLKSKTTIAYAKVLSIIMSEASSVPATQMNEVNRFIKDEKRRKAEQKAKTGVIHLQGDQIVPEKITKGWYAHAIYTSENKKETATGWIITKDAKHIVIHEFKNKARFERTDRWRVGKTWERAYGDIDTIAYGDIDAIVVANAKYRGSVEELKNASKAMQRFMTHNAKVRFKAPSLSKSRIVGEVVKMTQDTLLIREGRTFLEVPMSSISNFEASLGQRRNAGKGFMIGLGLGLAVLVPVAIEDYKVEGELQGFPTAITAVYIFPSIVVLSTLMGTIIKTEKWVEVSPQHLNLSIAPTRDKGLRAALTVNF